MTDTSKQPETYILNSGERPPVNCIDGFDHSWMIISQPPDCWNGWYVERCRKCGITQEYDTSD